MYDIDDLIEPQNRKKNIFAKTWKDTKGQGDSWQYERLGDTYGEEGPLVGREYQKLRKGYEAHVEFMPPERYYAITGRNPETLDRRRIDAIKRDAEKGDKISMPWLTFEQGTYTGDQEGHYRIKAAQEMGAEQVPVVMVNRDPKYLDKGWPMRSLEGKKKQNPFTYDKEEIIDIDF